MIEFFVIEPRTRIKGKSNGRVGNTVISFKRKGGKGGSVRVVDGVIMFVLVVERN